MPKVETAHDATDLVVGFLKPYWGFVRPLRAERGRGETSAGPMLRRWRLKMKQLKARSVMRGMGAGLIASICCAGSLVFVSVGLGAFYGALGLWSYIPQVLAAGALCIVVINYLSYRRGAERVHEARAGDMLDLKWAMFASAALGLAAMVVSFVFLEWLNHAVVNPHRFLSRPEYGQALIPGVPNIRLLYALASFSALGLLWALPVPQVVSEFAGVRTALRRGLQVVIFSATGIILIALVINAVGVGGTGPHERGPHDGGDGQKHDSVR